MNNLPRKKLVEKTLRQVREKYRIQGRFTKADFFRICEGEEILLVQSIDSLKTLFDDLKFIKGFCAYLPRTKQSFIYLRSVFLKRFDLFTAMHELGHYFLKHNLIQKDRVSMSHKKYVNSKHEREANYFSEMACAGQSQVSGEKGVKING